MAEARNQPSTSGQQSFSKDVAMADLTPAEKEAVQIVDDELGILNKRNVSLRDEAQKLALAVEKEEKIFLKIKETRALEMSDALKIPSVTEESFNRSTLGKQLLSNMQTSEKILLANDALHAAVIKRLEKNNEAINSLMEEREEKANPSPTIPMNVVPIEVEEDLKSLDNSITKNEFETDRKEDLQTENVEMHQSVDFQTDPPSVVQDAKNKIQNNENEIKKCTTKQENLSKEITEKTHRVDKSIKNNKHHTFKSTVGKALQSANKKKNTFANAQLQVAKVVVTQQELDHNKFNKRVNTAIQQSKDDDVIDLTTGNVDQNVVNDINALKDERRDIEANIETKTQELEAHTENAKLAVNIHEEKPVTLLKFEGLSSSVIKEGRKPITDLESERILRKQIREEKKEKREKRAESLKSKRATIVAPRKKLPQIESLEAFEMKRKREEKGQEQTKRTATESVEEKKFDVDVPGFTVNQDGGPLDSFYRRFLLNENLDIMKGVNGLFYIVNTFDFSMIGYSRLKLEQEVKNLKQNELSTLMISTKSGEEPAPAKFKRAMLEAWAENNLLTGQHLSVSFSQNTNPEGKTNTYTTPFLEAISTQFDPKSSVDWIKADDTRVAIISNRWIETINNSIMLKMLVGAGGLGTTTLADALVDDYANTLRQYLANVPPDILNIPMNSIGKAAFDLHDEMRFVEEHDEVDSLHSARWIATVNSLLIEVSVQMFQFLWQYVSIKITEGFDAEGALELFTNLVEKFLAELKGRIHTSVERSYRHVFSSEIGPKQVSNLFYEFDFVLPIMKV